ncbi:MAG: autotransporter assembly complex protein TamA [Gammaproteobacteria bacterium]
MNALDRTHVLHTLFVRLLWISIIFFYVQSASASPNSEPRVTGISGVLLKNVLARLATEERPNSENIRQALEPFGYFSPIIYTFPTHYHILPGPQLRIHRVNFYITGAGKHHPAFQKLRENFPIKQGQPFSSINYEAAKKSLLDAAEKEGFLTPIFTEHRVLVDLKKYISTIILHFDTGPRSYFGTIYFQENPLSPDFLKRYASFKPGEPYSEEKVTAFQTALNQSTYFKQVSIERKITQTQSIPLKVNLIPQKARQYSMGVGYGTDTSVRMSLGVDWTRLTRWGHRFSGLFRFSPVQNSIQAAYIIPGERPLAEQYSINASLFRTLFPQGKSMTQKLGIAQLKKMGFWEQTLEINYQRERSHLNQQPHYDSHLILPSIRWQYLKSDNLVYPSYGQRFNLKIQGASQILFSDTNLLQIKIEHKYIHRVTPEGRILLRGALGYTAVQNLDRLPLTLHFFAGGTQSVRGYTYQSLGPGRSLLVGSLEYQHRIKGNWNAAIYYDIGNAFNKMQSLKLRQGMGVGIVWVSPIGPINVSVAKALSLPGQPLQLQFSMGADL